MRRRDETGSRTELEKGQHQQPGILGWLRRNLFQSWVSTLQTILVLVVLVLAVRWAFSWLVIDADWVVQKGSQACPSDGFCWPFAAHNVHWLLVGWYPKDQLWRAYLSLGLLLVCPFLMVRWIHWAWSWRWVAASFGGSVVLLWLLLGGIGLASLPYSRFGGLLLTLLFSVAALALGIPGGVAIALARRSSLPVFRLIAFGFCWVFGGVPMIILIFIGSILLLLMLPEVEPPIRYFPASMVLILGSISAVSFSRPIRAGLSRIPPQQEAVAVSMGLSNRVITNRIAVPQALIGHASTLVAMVVWVIVESSLLVVVGLRGLYGMGDELMTEPAWIGEMVTMALVVGTIYLAIGLAIRRYGKVCEAARQSRTGGSGPLVLDPFPSP